jgi:hypothetical protein
MHKSWRGHELSPKSATMPREKTFSFAEIVQGRDAGVRVTDDNMLYAVDLVMVMTGLARDQSGLVLRRLSDEMFQSIKMIDRKMAGKGNGRTKLVGFQDAIELIMVLPGKVAKETRAKFADIIRRYLAGDKSLITEVEANAQSTAPIAQMARASLVSDEAPVQNEVTLPHKRRLEELEIAKLEVELESKRFESESSRRYSNHEYVVKCASSYKELCTDTSMDERARLVFKDLFLNMATLQGGPGMITNGDPLPSKPISLSLVAGEMGLKIPTNELISLGVELKKRYLAEHGKAPAKHDQLCDGRVTKVNSYSESDRPLVKEVLSKWASKSLPSS